MKQYNIFNSIFFLAFVILVVGLTSCENDTIVPNELISNIDQSQNITDNSEIMMRVPEWWPILTCTIRRASKDCKRGLGLCDCVWFGGVFDKSSEPQGKAFLDKKNNVIYLFGDEITKRASEKFHIDEEVLVSEKFNSSYGTILIQEGEYDVIEYDSEKAVKIPVSIK